VFAQRWFSVLPLPLTDADAADNLDLGRPEQIELIFAGRRVRPGCPPATPEVFTTNLVTRGVEVTINAFYQHSRIKQYLKDGRALRIETVINDIYDLGCQRRLRNLPELQTKARAVNRRLLDTERVGQGASLRAQPLSGSRTRPPRWTGGGPRPYGSAILGSRPWPAPSASLCTPSPASPTKACAP
jgi:hypothetical protein